MDTMTGPWRHHDDVGAFDSSRLGALAGMGSSWLAEGCGPGDTRYYCDNTGCYNCDGYGCHPVTPPSNPRMHRQHAVRRRTRSAPSVGCVAQSAKPTRIVPKATCATPACASRRRPRRRQRPSPVRRIRTARRVNHALEAAPSRSAKTTRPCVSTRASAVRGKCARTASASPTAARVRRVRRARRARRACASRRRCSALRTRSARARRRNAKTVSASQHAARTTRARRATSAKTADAWSTHNPRRTAERTERSASRRKSVSTGSVATPATTPTVR